MAKGDQKCPECGGISYVNTWKPGRGVDPRMRRFICSNCGTLFPLVITDRKLLKFYDRQLGRR